MEVTDAKRLQVRHNGGCGVEAEIGRELQPIGRARDRREHYPAPMLQNTDHGVSTSAGVLPQMTRPTAVVAGHGAGASVRLARSWSSPAFASLQRAEITPSLYRTAGASKREPARRGTISVCRVVSKRRTRSSRARAFGAAHSSQSSIAA